jgi:hypothetical protein
MALQHFLCGTMTRLRKMAKQCSSPPACMSRLVHAILAFMFAYSDLSWLKSDITDPIGPLAIAALLVSKETGASIVI